MPWITMRGAHVFVGKGDDLPSSKSKMNINRAAKLLKIKGMALGAGRTDLKAGKTFYKVKKRDGSTVEMAAHDIIKMVSK